MNAFISLQLVRGDGAGTLGDIFLATFSLSILNIQDLPGLYARHMEKGEAAYSLLLLVRQSCDRAGPELTHSLGGRPSQSSE